MLDSNLRQEPILELRHVSKTFKAEDGREVQAVKDVTLSVYPGECIGIVGESGCGKSTVARIITKLTEPSGGEIVLCGRRIQDLKGKALKNAYRDIQMVFQDPYSVFSPRTSVGTFLSDGLVYHGIMGRAKAKEEAKRLLKMVDLPEEFMDRMPHQLSGGQLQRVVIARAVSIRPKILLLDEATSALDVSVQKQVLELLLRLRKEYDLTFIFIGHDLAVVRSVVDRIVIMYSGMVVEELQSADLEKARHPYTKKLVHSVFSTKDRGNKVIEIEDMSAGAEELQTLGCPFQPRCPKAKPQCINACPMKKEIGPFHKISCFSPLTDDEM